MSEKSIAPKLQDFPKRGAPAEVKNPRPRRWFIACSKNSELMGGHRVLGHAMDTRRDAIAEWNKLS